MMQILRPAYNTKGFTLIEVLISITLLAFISILIYNATTRGYDVNRKLGIESSEFTNLIVSMQNLEKDIAQIYSPILPVDKSMENSAAITVTGFWSKPIRSDGIRRSRFIGTREKITFINNANHRLQTNSPESDLLKVTWEIIHNKNNNFSLVRSTDTDVFVYDEISEQKVKPVPLLDNLSSAKFSFYRKDQDKWEDAWDSEASYIKPENRFPELISLKIETPDPVNLAAVIPWEGIFRTNLALNQAPDTIAPVFKAPNP